jgi:hypothetical protein
MNMKADPNCDETTWIKIPIQTKQKKSVQISFKRTVYKVRDHDPDGHHDLERPSDATTHLGWRAFAHVGWGDCAYRANPKTGYDATTIDVPEPTVAFTICYRLQYLCQKMSK